MTFASKDFETNLVSSCDDSGFPGDIFYVSIADIDLVTAHHSLLYGDDRSIVHKSHFNWRNVMYGVFFVLWAIAFSYYVTVREHVPEVNAVSINATGIKCNN